MCKARRRWKAEEKSVFGLVELGSMTLRRLGKRTADLTFATEGIAPLHNGAEFRDTADMGRVTIVLLGASTTLLLVAFTKGMSLLHGGQDVMAHLYWAMAALIGVLGANFFAIFHAAQSDRIIRELRAALQK